jgi:tetratricopeptide (TPR) repeat protein
MYLRAGVSLVAFAALLASVPASAQEVANEPRMESRNALVAIKLQKALGLEDPLLVEESYRDALEDVYEAITRDPSNPTGYLHLGVARIGLTEYAAADSAFDQAEALYPNYLDDDNGTGVYRENSWIDAYNEGIAQLDAGNSESALEWFSTANMMFDLRPEAYLNLGATYANSGQPDASVQAWRDALAVIDSPDSKPRDEETRAQWVSELRPMALSNLAQVLATNDRPEEAIEIYRQILETDPNNDRARSGLAIALGQSGQAEDAIGIYDEILESDNASALDYFNAGVTLYGAEAYDRATIAFEKVLERAPMYRDALQNLVQTLALTEAYEAQLPWSQKLMDMDGRNYLAYQMHLRALSQLGRGEEVAPLLAVMQEMTFLVDDLQLQPRGDGGRVLGTVTNKLLEEGSSVTLRFHFYDDGGVELGTQDVSVPAPPVDVAQQFQLSIDTDRAVMGYSYEVVS